MKKITLLLFFLCSFFFTNAQVLNTPANWPNTAWNITGSYYVSSGIFEANPIINDSFSYDDNEAGFSSSNNIAAESPVINLTDAFNAGETLLTVTIDYVYNSQLNDTFAIQYYNATSGSWVNWVAFTTDTPGVGTNNYCSAPSVNYTTPQLDVSSFNATQLSGFKYRFYFTDNGYWTKGFCVSNPVISSEAPPTCPDPSGLMVDTFTDTSVTISWANGGAESLWEVVVQPTGTGTPTTNGVSIDSNPYTYNGLNGSTNYEIYLRADCTLGDYSNWIGPISFTTAPSPPTPPTGVSCTSGNSTILFLEEFDTPGLWTGNINNSGGSWEIPDGSTSAQTGPDTAYSGSNFMNFEATGASTSGSIVSPAIDLTDAEEQTELSFYLYAYGAGMGTLEVGIGTAATGPFTNAFTWVGQYQTAGNQAWIPVGIDLTAYNGQTIYVQFKQTPSVLGTTSYRGDMSIDYMKVEACGDFCFPPINISATNITSNEATFTWTSLNSETEWEYVLQPAGAGEPTTAGTTFTSADLPLTLSGLAPQTNYELYIKSHCSVDHYSYWSNPYAFTSALQTEYTVDCAVGPTNITYCYENNDANLFHFTGTDPSTPLRLQINEGTLEMGGWDYITIYDSDGISILYTGYGDNGNLAGINIAATGNEIFFKVTSDAITSCAAGGDFTTLDFTVRCITCQEPTVNYTVISDCAEAPQFVVNVEVVDMAGSSILNITDNQGGTPVAITTPGVYIFGSYANGTNVSFTADNPDDPNCFTTSQTYTQLECPPVYDVACSTIDAGDDVTLECGTEEAYLQANFTFSGTDTSTYQLSSIACESEITPGTPSSIVVDDVYSPAIDIGFDFCFFGNTYNQLVIGANGVVSFNTNLANQTCPWAISSNMTIPSNLLPLNSILGVFHDMNPATCGSIEYIVSGTAPNRSFTVNFNGVCLYGCPLSMSSSQIKLFEATNAIEINIIDKPLCNSWNNGLAVAGIQNATGTLGYAPPGRNTEVWTTQNESWRYVPAGPANYTFEWLDGTTSLGNNSTIAVSPLETTTYTAQISYNKCDGSTATLTDDVTVTVNIPVDANEFTLENATALPITPLNQMGSVADNAYNYTNYTNQPLEPAGTCFTNSSVNQTQWFSFVAPTSGVVFINTYVPDGYSDVEFAVYEATQTTCTNLPTPATQILCKAFDEEFDLSQYGYLTGGTTYYIQVNQPDNGSASDDFGIEVVQMGCTPAVYSSATVNADCSNNQYYVDVNITDLGNGTPYITDGTNVWNVTNTGTKQVGPFTDGTTTTLTLAHGIVDICDVDLGTFSSNCTLDCASNVAVTAETNCGNSPLTISWDMVTDATGYYITAGTTLGGTDVFNNMDVANTTAYTFTPEISTSYYITVTPYNQYGAAADCTPITYTTNSTECYCTSEPTSNNAQGITSILLNGNSITVPDTMYANFTSISSNIVTGETANMYIGMQTGGVSYYTNIWIDFNDNFIFDDNELVFQGESSTASPTVLNTSFVTPNSAATGQHRMRIGTADVGQQIPDPCYSGSFGVTVDLTVNVINNTSCVPATYTSTTVVDDCNNSQFYVNVNITGLGNGTPAITDGTNTWPINTTGIIQVGPFTNGSTAALTLTHGTDNGCDVTLGNYISGCPAPCQAATYNTAVVAPDCANTQYYVTVDITDLGNGTPAITDGTNTWAVTTTGLIQVGPFTNGSTTTLTLTHGTDTACDVAMGNFTFTCSLICQPATYNTATVSADCDNSQFYVAVDITGLGNGSPTITDGTNSWAVTTTGVMQVGPFADATTVNLTIEHGTDMTCDVDLGSFTYTCPLACEPVTYSTATTSADCNNSQFYVAIDITGLGNGSPTITDGTNSWPVTTTGVMQVGPFADASTVNLTIEHGTDMTCDVDLGSFTYTCPLACEPVTYSTATTSADCDNSQFYVAVDITGLGNGTPTVTDGTNSWAITSTGVMQVGPFADATTVTLTIEHGADGTCNVDLGSFTYTCPIICEPVTYSTATTSADCNNSQFYVAIDITGLGNGTPTVTEGTNSWPITSTGVMQVGPFADATTVTLTIEHGADATCNVDLGTYTYTCPVTPNPANDNLCNAIPLTVVDNASTSLTADYTTVGATTETNEPLPSCFSSNNGSVWFSFVAPEYGNVTVSTDYAGGTLTNTQIAVYNATGTTCATLSTLNTAIGCNQDSGALVTGSAVINFNGTENAALTQGTTYYVQVTSQDATQGTFAIEVIDTHTTGTKDFNNISFNYYPNPVKQNKLNLVASQEITQVEVYNLLGQKVMYVTPGTATYTLNMGQLAAGNYLVKVMINNTLKTFKITKE